MWDNQLIITADVAMKTIRIYATNYITLTGIHDDTRDIMSTNDGGGSSTDIIRGRRASSPTQSKSPKFEHRGHPTSDAHTPLDKRRTDAMGDSEVSK